MLALERKCERECAQSPNPLELAVCLRACMSPECSQVMYGTDPLEAGEIDVRFAHFRGCMAKRFRDARTAAHEARYAVASEPADDGWANAPDPDDPPPAV